ncbi:hypothetical protein ACE6H2_022571 [Prunus campanulata]
MAANEHDTDANGAIGLSSSSLLYETYGHPAQFHMAANNEHEIGSNFSATQNAGLPHSHEEEEVRRLWCRSLQCVIVALLWRLCGKVRAWCAFSIKSEKAGAVAGSRILVGSKA